MPKPVQYLTPKQKFELRQMREAGISLRECCTWFNCSTSTLHRALRELREKFGRERVTARKQYARVHLSRVRSEAPDAQ